MGFKRRLLYTAKEIKDCKIFVVTKPFTFDKGSYKVGQKVEVEKLIGFTERKRRQLYEQRFISIPEPEKEKVNA